ncbi:translocation/assembly module TamB domain-containing protein [Hellea sp.]|nr:translocation/assembly module TamB domain-containing protein [Hellea sp.]
MADTTQKMTAKKPRWGRHIGLCLLALLLIIILAITALRIFITTEPGARFIERQVNNRSFGPIKSVQLSGLSGDPLSDLSIRKIEIKDKDGVWLSVTNMNMEWSPLALLNRQLKIDVLKIDAVDALRRPILMPTTPSSQGDPYSISAEDFQVTRLSLYEALAGQRADFKITGGASTSGGEISARLDATRTDAAGDSINLNFIQNKAGAINGEFSVRGVAGGPLSQLLQAPEAAPVMGSGKMEGTAKEGKGNFNLTFNETDVAKGDVLWTAEQASVKADLNIEQWVILQPIAQRVGNNLFISGSADLGREDSRIANAPFRLNVKAPKLTLDASGTFPEEGFVPNGVEFTANIADISDLVELPQGFDAGKAVITGAVSNENRFSFNGRVNVNSIISPYGRAASITGPLSLRPTGEGLYSFSNDVKISGLTDIQDLPVEIGDAAQISSKGQINTEASKIKLETTKISTGPSSITANGDIAWEPLAYNLTGKTYTKVLAKGAVPAGALSVDYNVIQTPDSAPALSADGLFEPIDQLSAPFGEIIGNQLTFQSRMSPISGGVEITQARLGGDNIRAAIEGQITDSYDLSGEALLSSALTYQSFTLGEQSEMSFKLTGPRNDPALRLDASSSQVAISGQSLTSPRLRVEVRDILSEPKGPVQLEAKTDYGDLVFSTQFSSRPGAYVAEDITLKLGELTTNGQLSLDESKLVTGELKLDLAQEAEKYARASIVFAPSGTEQGIKLLVDAENVAIGEHEFDKINAKAEGSLAQLSGQFETKGRRNVSLLSRGFELNTPFALRRSLENIYQLELSPEGKYGDISLASSAPVALSYENGALKLEAPLTVAGQSVNLAYERKPEIESFELKAGNLPITLIPMPGNLADTRGRVGIDINLKSNGSSVSGGGDVMLSDWRGYDIKRESGIDATASLKLDGNRATLKLDGQSSSGFTANGSAQFGLNGATNLTSLRLEDNAPLSGEFKTSGAASAILGLVTPDDAELDGTLSASLQLSGTVSAPLIDGQASGQSITFEAPEIGTRIRNARFETNFRNDRLSVSDLYAEDTDEGTLKGSGEFTLGDRGRPLGSLNIEAQKFRALDRRDLEGIVSGKIAYESRQEDAELTGTINLNEVNVTQFAAGSTTVIEIEVDEINRPEEIQAVKFKKNVVPIKLNMKITAPRKIYVRSRGLDVELSTDIDITGSVTEPLFKGEAKLVRGGYKLAGKTLEFSEDSTVTFDGSLPQARLSLSAETETTDITAQVKITGTIEKPSIELTSTPDRPKDEILSVLLFGRSATELSTIEAAQLAGALAQFSGSGVGFDLLGGLRDAFGIGQLGVGFTEDGSAQITGGRYLSKNVYLQVFSGAGQDQTGAIIEWEIRKNLALRSRIQADNDQAFSLKYKKDF